MNRGLVRALAAAVALAAPVPALAQGKLTSPKEFFGFAIGDDYRLANYTQFTAYLKKLDAESERVRVESIGKTAEGRDQWMAVISSPANHKNIARYKEIAQRLARAEGLSDEQARALAREGKAVVWIDGGLHATEVLGSHQLIETVHQLASRSDEEALRFLNDLVILAVHANPDGMELVSNWYMREPDEKKRNSGDIPRLYQKYIGHDNNRDFYMNNQPETQNMSRILYREWFPQIMYNHHQTGPTGAVLFAPPFRDPFNYFFDPLIVTGLDLVGASMHNRFVAENKAGATMRRGANYSTWWNGGLRTTVYFHNMIGLLTETIGNPTPIDIEFVPQRQLPNGDTPLPIAPQKWHFRQSIEYSLTANWAVLDVASRHREQFLWNLYRMGKNSIERGSRDSWTTTPREIDAVREAAEKEQRPPSGQAPTTGAFDPSAAPGGLFAAARGGRSPVVPTRFFEMLRDPKDRDPRGYVITADQPDFLTATKLMVALWRSGIEIHRATQEFSAGGKSYPAGSYVIKTAQAFRPHVLDMFEPQDHPNDFASPGGPPIPPYDSAGWTLAYQMGVQFDRLLDGFTGPFEKLQAQPQPPPGKVAQTGAAFFQISTRTNDAFLTANRLMAEGAEVARLKAGPAAGDFVVAASPKTLAALQRAASDLGVSSTGVPAPSGETQKLRKLRIAIWDRYGGSMPTGWIRWLLEQYGFSYELAFPRALDAGNLAAKYDVLILPTQAVPERDNVAPEGVEALFGRQPAEDRVPDEFRPWLGNVTVAKTVPQIKAFLEAGGTVLAIGSSTSLARHLGLPVYDQLVEHGAAGERHLGRDKFYIPGSILRASVDTTAPLAWGMTPEVDVFFDNSPVFRLGPDAVLRGVRPVAWFASEKPLRSGWAWGQQYLNGGVAVAQAAVGKGRLLLYGPEITFRAQPHGTFKLLFNGIWAE